MTLRLLHLRHSATGRPGLRRTCRPKAQTAVDRCGPGRARCSADSGFGDAMRFPVAMVISLVLACAAGPASSRGSGGHSNASGHSSSHSNAHASRHSQSIPAAHSGNHSGSHSATKSNSFASKHSSGHSKGQSGSATTHSTGKSGPHSEQYSAGAKRDPDGKIHRSAAAKGDFKKSHPCPSTSKSSGACPGYVIDHVKPLKRGGADSPSNMQWQTTAAAKAKDKTE